MFIAKNEELIILANDSREVLEEQLKFMVYTSIEETTETYKLVNGKYVNLSEAAEVKREEIVNKLYEIKADKAYGGVIINEEFVFETNQVSITNTVASLALMSETATANWKFYTIDGVPVVKQITKAQLYQLAQFGQNMINSAFAVEGTYNTQLQEATVEQLNDEEWCETFIQECQDEMDEISNEITINFVEEAEEE